MILKIKNWCEEIIIAVILCIIIESLIPKGNNSKYIKVITGIYIMYITLNPIFNLLNYEINFEKLFAEFGDYEETSTTYDENLKDIYILGIENNIKEDIKKLGFKTDNVKVFVDINYENIEKIEIEKIGVLEENSMMKFENEIDNSEIIKEHLAKNYNIEKDIIVFK